MGVRGRLRFRHLLFATLFANQSIADASPPNALAQEVLENTDWARAEVESTLLMSRYLATDTVNPPGNEALGAQFIAETLAEEGLESRIVEFAPGRASVFSKLQGNGEEGALCLFSHIDVVPAEEAKWSVGSLSGRIQDGYLWGRGALDMKGAGALQLQDFRMIHRTGLTLRRDVVL